MKLPRLLAILAAAAMAMGCQAGPGSVAGPRVTIINETDEVFTVEANGAWVGTVGPRARATLPFPLGDGTTSVTAANSAGHVLVSVDGTRAMFENAIDGTVPMSAWQDLTCGRILIATEPFDESIPGPISNPCP